MSQAEALNELKMRFSPLRRHRVVIISNTMLRGQSLCTTCKHGCITRVKAHLQLPAPSSVSSQALSAAAAAAAASQQHR